MFLPRESDLVALLKLCSFCVVGCVLCHSLAVPWIGQWSAIVTILAWSFSLVHQIMFEQNNVHSSQNQDEIPNSKKGVLKGNRLATNYYTRSVSKHSGHTDFQMMILFSLF